MLAHLAKGSGVMVLVGFRMPARWQACGSLEMPRDLVS